MTPAQVQAIIDALFAEFESLFAGNIFVTLLLNTLQKIADSLIPVLVSRVNSAPER